MGIQYDGLRNHLPLTSSQSSFHEGRIIGLAFRMQIFQCVEWSHRIRRHSQDTASEET